MELEFDGVRSTVSIVARRPDLRCRVDEHMVQVVEAAAGDGRVLLTIDGREYTVWRVAEGDRLHLKLGTRTYSVSVEDPVAAAAHDGGDNDEIRADMPGVVVALRCQVGEEVEAGQPLLTLESMKMQITINAHRRGVVAAIHAGVNEPFQKGALLLALHAEQETSAP